MPAQPMVCLCPLADLAASATGCHKFSMEVPRLCNSGPPVAMHSKLLDEMGSMTITSASLPSSAFLKQ